MQKIAENPTLIAEYSKKAYACGEEHHDKEKMNQLLLDTITGVCREE